MGGSNTTLSRSAEIRSASFSIGLKTSGWIPFGKVPDKLARRVSTNQWHGTCVAVWVSASRNRHCMDKSMFLFELIFITHVFINEMYMDFLHMHDRKQSYYAAKFVSVTAWVIDVGTWTGWRNRTGARLVFAATASASLLLLVLVVDNALMAQSCLRSIARCITACVCVKHSSSGELTQAGTSSSATKWSGGDGRFGFGDAILLPPLRLNWFFVFFFGVRTTFVLTICRPA